jgi:hypothetical protein
MTLADQIKTDARRFVDPQQFGEQITYTPKGGQVRSINALVDPTFDRESGSLVNTQQSLVILSDEVTIDPTTGQPIGIANPQAGDICVVRGLKCRVASHVRNPDGLHELEVDVGALVVAANLLRDERPMAMYTVSIGAFPGAPKFGNIFRDDAPIGCGGYTNGYNFLIGEEGCVAGASHGPNEGFKRPFERFLFHNPIGLIIPNSVGSYPIQPHGSAVAGLPWLHDMYRAAIAYMRTTGGKTGLSVDFYVGMAVSAANPSTAIGVDRLFNATDTWVTASLQAYYDDGFDGALFIDAAAISPFFELVPVLQSMAPLHRIGCEGLPLLGNTPTYTLNVNALVTGPALMTLAQYRDLEDDGLGEDTFIAPPAPHHEAIVVVTDIVDSEADLDRLISLVERGFVLGSSLVPAGDDLLWEAYELA